MSSNLVFKTKKGNHFIEFPYQTTTKVTKEVLSLKTVDDRMIVIKKDLNPDFDSYTETISDIRSMMEDETIFLDEC